MYRFRRIVLAALLASFVFSTLANPASAQQKGPTAPFTNNFDAGDSGQSEMRSIIESYVVDRGSLQRSYPVSFSAARRERFRQFYTEALDRIKHLNFDRMSEEGKIDYILFQNHLEHELRQLQIEENGIRLGAVE